jgi:hypothetical protein
VSWLKLFFHLLNACNSRTHFLFLNHNPALLFFTGFIDLNISVTRLHFLNLKTLCMKKINYYLHKPDVQGAIIISFIFIAIVAVTVLTWGK